MDNINTELVPVFFHKDIVLLTGYNGEPYTAMRPIIENMGLAWQVQHRKITSNSKRWGVTIMVTPSEGGEQNTLCIPVRKLAGFLATINPKKVRPDLREKIELYQEECDNALWNYWTKGQAIRKPAVLKEIRDTHNFIKKFISIATDMGHSRADAKRAAIETATREGLRLPQIIIEEKSNSINCFASAWLNGETGFPLTCAKSRDLYRAYEKYCSDNGLTPELERLFYVTMREIRGIEFRRAFKEGFVVGLPKGGIVTRESVQRFSDSIAREAH